MLMAMIVVLIQGPVPPPAAPLHYRVEAKTTLDQDLTSIGRGKVTGSLSTTVFVAVSMSDSADGQVARVAVDSMKYEPTGAMALQVKPEAALAAADSARGAWVHAYSVRGTLRGVPQPSTMNPALAPVMQAVSVMFPGLRSGIKVGDKWADTTKIDGDVQGGHQIGNVVATWNVVGVDADGELVLDGNAVTKVTTTGQNGESLTVNGNSHERLVMARRGPSHSASIESTRDATTVQKEGSAPIPSRTTGLLRITQLP